MKKFIWALMLVCVSSFAHAQTVAPMPNARLGLSQNLHWLGDITGATTLYYTDDQTSYSDAGPWTASTLYDEFFSGTAICHQAWVARTSGAPPAASTCSGVYIGSAASDANGQFNQHKTPGPKRHWDVWNAFNQVQVDLQVVDGNTNDVISAQQTSWVPITANSYAVFIIGLPEQANCLYLQQVYPYTAPGGVGNATWGTTACGWGASFANPVAWSWPTIGAGEPGGTWGQQGLDSWISNQVAGDGYLAPGGTAIADYDAVDIVGVQTVYSVVISQTLTGASAFTKFAGVNGIVQRIMHIRFPG